MHDFITNIFFFSCSILFKKDVETTKTQLKLIEQKIIDGSFKSSDYSPEMNNMIDFYINNKQNLSVCLIP